MNFENVFDFDWKRDIESTLKKEVCIMEMNNPSQPTCGEASIRLLPTVQMDTDDLLILKGADTSYYPTISTWTDTIDKYLIAYLLLAMRNSIPDSDNFGVGLETVKLPERLARSYRNYKKQFKPKQGKLSVYYSVFSEVKDKSDTENTDYVFGSLIDPLYLRHFCRDISTYKQAHQKKTALEYDGLLFNIEGKENIIPPFPLADYIFHEILTGISLSIEVAAIRLELQQKLKRIGCSGIFSEDFSKKAYSAFKEKMLPNLVISPFIFTRISVARYFFRQIMFELELCYRREGLAEKSLLSDEKWSEMLQHALYFLNSLPWGTLDYYDKIIDFTCDMENAALKLEQMICSMKAPVEFSSVITKENRILAIFCNPKHTNVNRYLQILKEREMLGIPININDIDGNKQPRKITNGDLFSRHNSKAELLFQEVHGDAREILHRS